MQKPVHVCGDVINSCLDDKTLLAGLQFFAKGLYCIKKQFKTKSLIVWESDISVYKLQPHPEKHVTTH